MDLRLFALLILCYWKQGWTQNDIVSDDEKDPVIPLTPLVPSSPRSDLGSSNASHTEEWNSYGSDICTSTDENGENSSEEDLDEFCAHLSSLDVQQSIGNGIMKFGLQLLENIKETPKQPNVIISPLSVSLALSQLALGAKNDTEELLLQHLHADAILCYHKALKTLLHQVRKNALQVASRIYLAQGFKPKPEFMEESWKIYDSKPAFFTDLENINEWVEKSTNGHVTDFMTSLPSNLVMMLINAVHYKGEWRQRFDPDFTTTEPFYINEYQMVDVDMMLGSKYPLSVFTYNDLDAQVARFPFKGNMSLVIVMPMTGKVNVSEIASKLNISDLYHHFPRERNMRVKIPKFKLEFTQELEEALTSMGLGELFRNPNLAGISEGPLLVSSVQHKSTMEINEEGAEAAATTSVAVSRSNLSFIVNQPFFLALVEDSSQTPLFLGVISNPNPKASAKTSNPILDKTQFPVDKHYPKSFDKPPK